MSEGMVLDLVRDALYTVIIVSAPPLIIALTVGIAVSIFQTVTSIQEPTLAFVPKILAVLVALVVFGSFMLSTLKDFIINLYSSFPDFIKPL